MGRRILPVLLCTGLLLMTAGISAGEKLSIPGTGDSEKLLQQLAGDFEARFPGTTVEIPSSVGTMGGLRRLQDDSTPLARIARPLTKGEQRRGLRSRVFAYSPVVFVANLPSPCAESLSSDDVVGIFSGRITSWGEIGSCEDHKIYVANREEGDSCRRVLADSVPGWDRIERFAGKVIFGTPEALKTLERHPYTIGYLPLAMTSHSSLVRLRFEKISPSLENVQAGIYPLAVPLAIAWRGELSGTAREFLAFLFTPEAKRIIQQHGAVPADTVDEAANF